MRVVIFGGRNITDRGLVDAAVRESGFAITEVIEGGQRTYDKGGRIIGGVDWLAKRWAIDNNIPYRTISALWTLYGKSAGPRRNSVMAEHVAHALPDAGAIAIWDSKSRGTKDMLDKVKAFKIPFHIKEVQSTSALSGDPKVTASVDVQT